MKMKYQQVMEYLRDALVLGSVPGLDSIVRLTDEMDSPQKGLSFVHVAGTNGKGSTCTYIAEILKAAGYKVGLYTSPYIRDFSERIQVNGVPISQGEIEICGGKVIAAAERMVAQGFAKPTVFELTTAMGFEHFKNCGCDIVVLEVGLGGRLDATNVIDSPALSVITAIDLDHTELLGDTVEKIALEKAGIIKTGRPVVMAGQSAQAVNAVKGVCMEKGCALTLSRPETVEIKSCGMDGLVFDYGDFKDLRSGLFGLYQTQNAATAIEAALALRAQGYAITEQHIRAGLEKAFIPGRLEILSKNPPVVIDGAHNPQGAAALKESLEAAFPNKKFRFVMGALADKDYKGAIDTVAHLAERFYTVTPAGPRALQAEALAEEIKRHGIAATTCNDMMGALTAALNSADENTVVCVFGSLYIMGDAENCFENGQLLDVSKSGPEYSLQDAGKPAPAPKKGRMATRTLCQIALLIALEVVLNRFCSFNTMSLKIGFSFIPMALCAYLFGPWYTMVAYALSDFIGAILFPIGPYHPGFTLGAALMGIAYGFLLNRKYWKKVRFFPNMVLAAIIPCIAVGLFVNTAWVAHLAGGHGYWWWVSYRLPQYAVLVPLNLIFLPLLKKLADKLKKAKLV
ncbi:MAG: folate family ECF transporter S component [Oscillospiraceae bacterium]|nr:folate family ECF transporter S component [Oscillospiraceae bacterium]